MKKLNEKEILKIAEHHAKKGEPASIFDITQEVALANMATELFPIARQVRYILRKNGWYITRKPIRKEQHNEITQWEQRCLAQYSHGGLF